MSTHDKLTELRDDTINAWRIAIGLTHAFNNHEPVTLNQVDMALMGAVTSQARYTLACQLCAYCGHRTIEHSQDNPPHVRRWDTDAGTWVDEDACRCCIRVGKAMDDNDDRNGEDDDKQL